MKNVYVQKVAGEEAFNVLYIDPRDDKVTQLFRVMVVEGGIRVRGIEGAEGHTEALVIEPVVSNDIVIRQRKWPER